MIPFFAEHAQPPRKRSKPFQGAVKLARDSSVRKLARALRRGTLDHMQADRVNDALRRAAQRYHVYLNARQVR